MINQVIHDLASQRVLVPLSYAGRAARPSKRSVYRAFARGLRFRRSARDWSNDRKREWMLTALRQAVRHAWNTTTLYRERLEKCGFDPLADFTFEEFGRLPVLERADLRAAERRAISSAIDPAQLHHDATGGSTGVPTELWKGPEERGWGESGSEYFMQGIGIPQGSSVALLWGHHLDPVHRTSMSDRIHDWWFNVAWYDCFRLSSDKLAAYHRELQMRRPYAMVAYAGALAALAEFVVESGDRPRYPRHAFVTGAEKLLDYQRATIEQAFGKPVHERYGGRDVGLVAFQTRPSESLTLEIDWADKLIEPATTDQCTTDILITKLHGDGMPMLRYRVGDIGTFPVETRPDTPTLKLGEVVGRDVSRLWLPNGRWIHGISIPHLIKDYPIRDFQFVQRRDLSVEIRIVPGAGYNPEHGRHLTGVVSENLPGVPLSLQVVDEIARTRAGKRQPVISEALPTTLQR